MTLKELREARGLTQVEVAKKVDVDQAAISHWERGRYTPCRKYLKKMARLYGCSEDELRQSLAETKEV